MSVEHQCCHLASAGNLSRVLLLVLRPALRNTYRHCTINSNLLPENKQANKQFAQDANRPEFCQQICEMNPSKKYLQINQ